MMSADLIKARAAVREAEAWLEACGEDITYPGEEYDALAAYHAAAEAFFELFDTRKDVQS